MSLKKPKKWLLFFCLLFLPTQLGKHFFLKFSYIYSLPVDYLAPTIYFWDILALGLFISWLLQKAKINKTALLIMLFFIFTQLISLLNASNLGAGLFRVEQLLITGLFGVYIASQDMQKLLASLKWPLFISLVFESILALLQFLSGRSLGFWILGERSFSLSTPLIAKFDFFGQVFLRPYGSFPHPNVLAAFLVVSITLIAYLFNNQIKWISIVVGFLGLTVSFSRVAIVIATVELVVLLRNRLKLLVIPILILTPFLAIRFGSAFNFDSLSIIRREELASISIVDFKQSPILGIGLNNFINQTAVSNLIAGPNRFLQPVHNIFLLSLAETGLVGLSGLFVLLIIPVRRLIIKSSLRFAKRLILIWLIIIFLGMFDHYFLTLAQGQRMFFLIWGLSMLELNNGSGNKGF